MTDYVYIQIALPLKPDAPADLADQVIELIGPYTTGDGSRAVPAALTGRISIDIPDLPEMADSVVVAGGQLLVDAMTGNTQRPRRIEQEDGSTVESDRSTLAYLFELLSLHAQAPLGAIVGAIHGDWTYDMGGPIVMASDGLVALSSRTQELDHGWFGPMPVEISAIPEPVASRLVRNGGDWADYTDADVKEIIASAEAAA